MSNKYLERKVKLQKENAKQMELEYYLLESNVDSDNDMSFKKVYGIEIVKRDNKKFEMKAVQTFSHCREKTINVLSKLANNTVTPLDLPFILDDILAE